MIKKVWSFLKEYKLSLSYTIILSIIVSFIGLYIPIVVASGIDNIVAIGNVSITKVSNVIKILAVLVVIYAVLDWIANLINNRITFNIARDFRNKLIKKIEKLPIEYIDANMHGDIVSRVILDVDQISDGIFMGFSKIISGVFQIVFTIIFMSMINIKLSVIVILLTPIAIVVANYISKATYNLYTIQSKLRGDQTAYTNEIIKNQKVVLSFGQEKTAAKTFNSLNMDLEDVSIKALFYSSIVNPVSRFINNIVYAIIVCFGSIGCINGILTVGGLTCLLNYAVKYHRPFNEITSLVSELQNAMASLDRVNTLLEVDEEKEIVTEVIEKAYSIYGDYEDEDDEEKVVDNTVLELKDIKFSYDKKHAILKDISFKVNEGKKIAIVGQNGAGKTTLINLIMRFYDVQKGEISFKTKDINKINKAEYRTNFAMVLQDTFIKTGTIRDNIKIGKMDATDEEVEEAAKKANSYNFISNLPDGFDTVVSNEDGKLSEGERQLIAITRVMLLNPPILVLDEATSNIDTRTEVKIQEAFDELMKDKTTIVIAHRLSTIKNSDLILVVQDGKIVESGKHDELMYRNGHYANLYNTMAI